MKGNTKMANASSKIKAGMGGSNNGRSRRLRTEELKSQSKKARRNEGKLEAKL